MTAPDYVWIGQDKRYVGNPWIRFASEFDDEDDDGEVCEYVRADLVAALIRDAVDAERIDATAAAAERWIKPMADWDEGGEEALQEMAAAIRARKGGA